MLYASAKFVFVRMLYASPTNTYMFARMLYASLTNLALAIAEFPTRFVSKGRGTSKPKIFDLG